MNKWFQFDERTDRVNEKISFLFLSLTQLMLYLALVIQRYMDDLTSRYYNDVTVIFLISVIGYWGARLFFGGILPVLDIKKVLGIYAFLVLSIAIPYTLVHGWPGPGEWLSRIAPMLIGPALIIGVYSLLAYFGKKRIEHQMTSQ